MTTATALEAERLADLGGLEEALNRAGLPVADLDRPGRVFFRFSSEGGTVGFGGLEGNAPDMLLRSVAVAPGNQNQGHGGRIVAALERDAAALGATRLHLLTNTAARVFRGRGYEPADRRDAPAPVVACEQFRSLCPASASYLVKRLSG